MAVNCLAISTCVQSCLNSCLSCTRYKSPYLPLRSYSVSAAVLVPGNSANLAAIVGLPLVSFLIVSLVVGQAQIVR